MCGASRDVPLAGVPRGTCSCDSLSPSTARPPSKRDTENTIACAPSKGGLKMPKARISTGSKPETMGGDGLTGPDQQQHDLHDQGGGTRDEAGSQDQARPEQGRKDTAQRARKKFPNGFAAERSRQDRRLKIATRSGSGFQVRCDVLAIEPTLSDSTLAVSCSGTMLTRSPHDTAFLDGRFIFLPFGNSTNRRTTGPSLSTTYLVPSGKRLGSRDALRT
jgi:hypothetical protein